MKMLLIKDLLKNLNKKAYFLDRVNNGCILIIVFKNGNNNNEYEIKKVINYLNMFNFNYRIIDKDLNSISIDIA